jgi:hypothetical protein
MRHCERSEAISIRKFMHIWIEPCFVALRAGNASLRAKRSNLGPQIHAYLDRACFVAR